MPVRFALPLPGPFYWTSGGPSPRRLAKAMARATTHRSRFHSLAYWLLGGWAIEVAFWITVLCCLAAWWLLRLTAAAVLFFAALVVQHFANRTR